MWTAPVTILDDEDEAALLARFVELSAAYPNYTAFDIAQEVFRGLPDSELRANQAGLVWGNQLAVKERIRKARANGNVEPTEVAPEEKAYQEAMARFNDDSVPWTVRYKFFEIAQKIKGLVKEPAEAGKDNGNRVSHPTFVFAQYPDQ